jgi:UDP-N-acetylmuramoyl-L-alanyl-D-glutamate--2,6-diaminopimelate ligase
MRLAELLKGYVTVSSAGDFEVQGLALDSRQVGAGYVFVALQGIREHGIAYVERAIAEGAAAVIWESSPEVSASDLMFNVPAFEISDLKQQLGEIAARFYQSPSRNMVVFGVTGTDGKTSVAHILADALDDQDLRAGYVGTLGYGLVGDLHKANHTTPDAITLQGELARIRNEGAHWVALEVSSHALDQGRVSGVAFDVAIFTNLSRDHLDYHGDIEAYAAAKRRLFQRPGLKTAVINLDDSWGDALADSLQSDLRVLGYGIEKDAYEFEAVVATEVEFDTQGVSARVVTPWGEGELRSKLLGRFNVQNLLAALAAMLVEGVGLDEALLRLSKVVTVPGRMESFGGSGQPLVVVDYAHTPAALEHVLGALQEHCAGRLWCIFGCGGDRDQGKRPLMAAVAEQYADEVIVTNDNPRREDPDAILADIMSGFAHPDQVYVEPDRVNAIEHVLSRARPDDVVLVAGKGHETVQIVGEEKIYLSDREEVVRQLQEALS